MGIDGLCSIGINDDLATIPNGDATQTWSLLRCTFSLPKRDTSSWAEGQKTAMGTRALDTAASSMLQTIIRLTILLYSSNCM